MNRWCWHRYPKRWADATASYVSLLFRHEPVQIRRCEKCNKTQMRRLT